MSIDQIIALIASIGSCLAAIATFLTVRQMDKQREMSYRPELAFSQVIFEGINRSDDSLIPDVWAHADKDSSLSDSRFCIPIRNIGLGSAKSIQISWSFPVEHTIQSINTLAQETLSPAHISYKGEVIHLSSKGIGSSVSMWMNQKEATFDYLSPGNLEADILKVEVPHAYQLLISALIYFTHKSKNLDDFNPPNLSAEISYLDIAEKKLGTHFEIEFHYVWGQAQTNHFRAHLNPKKKLRGKAQVN